MLTDAKRLRIRRMTILAAAMTGATLAAGCGSYYRVNDTAGDREYYTRDIDRMRSGAIKFTDQRTGSEVTIQSSEVLKISKKQYEEGVGH